jgi:hypothetical protein
MNVPEKSTEQDGTTTHNVALAEKSQPANKVPCSASTRLCSVNLGSRTFAQAGFAEATSESRTWEELILRVGNVIFEANRCKVMNKQLAQVKEVNQLKVACRLKFGGWGLLHS